MKIPFRVRETLTVTSGKDKLLQAIKNHTNADDRNFERMFVGRVDKEQFRLIRVKKFGLWDYCITSLRGIVKNKDGGTELCLTYKLMWWYAIEFPIIFLFFGLFVTFAALSDKVEKEGIAVIVGTGIVALMWTSLRYKRRYEEDKEKYRNILEQMIYKCNVR